MQIRMIEKIEANKLQQIREFDCPEHIKAYLIKQGEIRAKGLTAPTKHDLSHLITISKAEGKFKEAYKPLPGCSLRLKLKEAIHYAYQQDAYANYSFYIIPVTGEAAPDNIETCRKNLSLFCQSIRTANGVAGHGSTWDSMIVYEPSGAYALLSSRSSIPD